MDLEKLKEVSAGRYDMKANELVDLYEYAKIDISGAIILAFKHGFIRGQRAEKNQAKRRCK